jgi:erythromycin esterase-like protein
VGEFTRGKIFCHTYFQFFWAGAIEFRREATWGGVAALICRKRPYGVVFFERWFMAAIIEKSKASALREFIHEIHGAPSDYDSLIDAIGTAKYVLLGEATHGTHEFYKARAELTKRLIREKGFNVIAWEADWPDAQRVHRYIQGHGDGRTSLEALSEFKRFPQWMWRNADILDLVGWLRSHNEHVSVAADKIGVHGLDLYSLHKSIEAVISYFDRSDPTAAAEARRRYSCFEAFGEDPQIYGMTTGWNRALSCEEEVVEQLVEMQKRSAELLQRDGKEAADELFFAKQNAFVAAGAEKYYRAMFRGRPNTWNLRDTHMADTLDRLMEHLETHGQNPKAVIWAHNSHLGDARATTMQQRGEVNIGQLVRERHGREAFSVGFSTYCGTVAAASEWDGPVELKSVRPGMEGSWEDLFHNVEVPRFLLLMNDQQTPELLNRDLLERAIGVLYLPETERMSHYFYARIARQFDAVIHFDESRAVEPLDRTADFVDAELPETYPSAL